MNDATKQALEQFVTKMLSAAEQGASWTADQAPLLVQEWLRWQLVNSALWALVFVAITTLIAIRMLPWAKRGEERDEFEFGAAWVSYSVVQLLTFIAAAVWVESLLKVLIAPRVVVLEKFADLIK